MHEDKLPPNYKNGSIWNSLKSAWRGFEHGVGERNFKIELAIGALAIALAFVFPLSRSEQIIIIVLAALVLGTELLNSALEVFLDLMVKEHSTEVAKIKELLAAAVFVFSIAALVIGLWIFGKVLF